VSKHPVLSARPQILFNAIAKALESSVIKGNNAQHVVNCTKNWLSLLPPAEAQGIFNSLSPETKQAVQKYFA